MDWGFGEMLLPWMQDSYYRSHDQLILVHHIGGILYEQTRKTFREANACIR